MIDDLSKEKLPIILDESFAYFDNSRLENILKYLNGELNNHQTIILTYLKYYKKEREPINIMEKYIRQLMHYFGITTQDSEHYLKNESSLKTVIYDSLNKKI